MATEYLIGNVKGIKGDKGEKGAIGLSPNLTIGTVTTGNAGTQANATITGTTPNLELSLTIPQGENGITPNNITGNAGTATKLETARKINGVDFDGTKDISVTGNSFVSWSPKIKNRTWSKIYSLHTKVGYSGTAFILNLTAVGNGLVLNFSTFINTGGFEPIEAIVLPSGFYNESGQILIKIVKENVFLCSVEVKLDYYDDDFMNFNSMVASLTIISDINNVSVEKYTEYTESDNKTGVEIDCSSGSFNKQLQSNDVGQGSSLIGISDTANNFTSTNVEGALLELANKVKTLENK